jgi:hypothetical protein
VYGVWVVRDGRLRFALPLTVGPRSLLADYLPAPHGLAGFAAPVEHAYPALVPFLEMEDGRTYAAAGPARSVEVAKDGRSLTALWTSWAELGSEPDARFPIGLTSEVKLRVKDRRLVREETLRATSFVKIRKWRFAVPMTREGVLVANVKAPSAWRVEAKTVNAADEPMGRGARGPIPVHLAWEARDIVLAAGKSARVTVELEPRKEESEHE